VHNAYSERVRVGVCTDRSNLLARLTVPAASCDAGHAPCPKHLSLWSTRCRSRRRDTLCIFDPFHDGIGAEQEQLAHLQDEDCIQGQGYLLARPVRS
jgi:hypothetical protein